jgi:REP element-mobilizing transposase RayT
VRTCAIHVIWTTYLTWLPGDERGHWSALFDFYGNLIERGHHLNLPDATTKSHALQIAKEQEKVLSDRKIEVVADELGVLFETDPVLRGISVLAGAIERTHVHLLLGAMEADISQVVGKLKGRTSSRVLGLAENAGRGRTWTSGFWKVFLFDDEGTLEVKRYVQDHNLRRGLCAAPYPWIRLRGGGRNAPGQARG